MSPPSRLAYCPGPRPTRCASHPHPTSPTGRGEQAVLTRHLAVGLLPGFAGLLLPSLFIHTDKQPHDHRYGTQQTEDCGVDEYAAAEWRINKRQPAYT